MEDLSDGFIALPGGFGTLDEVFEVLTGAQLGFHAKPCGLLNIHHYYDDLLAFLDHTVAEQFVHRPHREMVHAADNVDDLIDLMAAFDHPPVRKTAWVHAINKK